MEHQTSMLRGQPDEDAIKYLQYWETFVLGFDPRGYCVCTSEGKDSRVVGHLMRRAGVKHFYIHNITGIDPPELIYFQRANFEDYRAAGYQVHEIRPQYTMWELMQKNRVPPLRQMRYCCTHLKEARDAVQGRAVLSMGVRRYESHSRMKNRGMLEKVNGTGGRRTYEIFSIDNVDTRKEFEDCREDAERRINPIAEWTNEDVWNYTHDVKLKQCCLYDEGFERLGCIGCPMAREKTRRMELKRWPGFARLYMRTFERMLTDRKKVGLTVRAPCDTASGWFDWWLSDTATSKVNDAQLDMWKWESDEYV